MTESGQARSAAHLGEGAYKTLTLLETTGPAPLTATHKRSTVLLSWLVEQELVALRGQLMDLTDKGRESLVLFRVLKQAAEAELDLTDDSGQARSAE